MTDSVSPLGIDRSLFHCVDALKTQIKNQEAVTKADKQRLVELEAELVDQFTQAGVADLTLDGRKGYLKPEIWAGRVDDSVTPEQIANALEASDLGYLVTPRTVNWQSLSAYVRELDDQGQPLPEALAKVIEARPRTKIGFSRGTAATRRAAARSQRVSHAVAPVGTGGESTD